MNAAVTAMAANTSLGDTVTACAAVRARLSRPAPLDRQAFDDEEGPKPITGHPVPAVAGFQGEARLLSLALPAVKSLVASMPNEEVGLVLALPDVAARAKVAGVQAPRSIGLLNRLLGLTGLRTSPPLCQTFPSGHAGFAMALQAAMQLLAQGRVAACVVGGVDSLCDDLALDAFAAASRLKTGINPVGLQPGEAAAFLLIETPNSARRRNVPPLALLTGVTLAREPRGDDPPPVGEGLAQAVLQLAAATGPLPPRETFFVLDRNGEAIRASDWGYCQRRLVAKMPGLLPAPEWDPAISFGDTGAASGALAAQLVTRGYARGYAPGRTAVLLSSSDGGGRAAIRIERGA